MTSQEEKNEIVTVEKKVFTSMCQPKNSHHFFYVPWMNINNSFDLEAKHECMKRLVKEIIPHINNFFDLEMKIWMNEEATEGNFMWYK
jgi:hypothetical protein